MEATSKKAANAVLRIIVAIGLLTGLIVVPMTMASANTNEAPVNPGSISNWSPAGLTAYSGCPTAAEWPEELEDYDLYHWVVTDQNYNVGSGSTAKKGKWSANFKKSSPQFVGSSYVEYTDGGNATLPWVSFGYSNIPSNHLYTAVPAGKQVVVAKLNYVIDVNPNGSNSTQQDANYSAPTSTVLNSSHVLSHTCPTPFSDPVIDVLSVDASYDVSHDEYYDWTLSKALDLVGEETANEKWFEQGLPPVYVITGTKSGPFTTEGSYEVTSVLVEGTFTLDNADLADATISFEANTGSDLGSDPDCDVAASTPAGTFTFDCAVDVSEITGDEKDLLDKRAFTIRGSVIDGIDDTLEGSFGAAAEDDVDQTTGDSATLDDDLAGLGGALDADDCDLDGGGEDATCVIEDGDLAVSDISESFTVTYTGGWDWEDYETTEACETAQENTATLSPKDQDLIERTFELQPKCPTPEVTLGEISSEYDISYDNVYTWSITKTLGTVSEDKLAPYTVTATRSGPNVENVEGSDVTVTGSFTTEFATANQVSVEITKIGATTPDTPIACVVDRDESTFECTIPIEVLPALTADDTESGWDELDFTVKATVSTAGGEGSDSNDEILGTPSTTDDNTVDASANIVDDLDGYAASSIECVTGADEDESCWDGTGDDDFVTAGSTITTESSDTTIVLTYDLAWLASLKLSDECPTIANTAEVFGNTTGSEEALDSETTSDEMTCPALTLSALHDPAYTHTWDTTYSWTLDKSFVEFDPNTWQPKYSVTATRGSGTDANFSVVDGTQEVTGTLTLALNPATSIPTAEDAAAALTLDGLDECEIGAEATAGTAGTYSFSCTVEDEPAVTAKDGLASTSYTLGWSGSAYGSDPITGNNSKTWGNATSYQAGDDVNASATITDDTNGIGAVESSIVNGSQDETTLTSTDSTTFTMSYTLNWQWDNGNGCGQQIVNTATLDGSTDEGLATDSVTTTVNCPNAVPAFTIGYYGNKAGGTQVVKNKGQWRTSKPGWAPAWNLALGQLSDFANDSAVRTYMNNANCNSGGANSGGKTCQTMFRAQALASVNNAIRNGAPLQGYMVSGDTIGRQFANQHVLFLDPLDGAAKCWKVHEILAALAGSGLSSVDGGTSVSWINRRIAYKTIFDDLNNARAKRCPLVP